jgi:hypothetical protein
LFDAVTPRTYDASGRASAHLRKRYSPKCPEGVSPKISEALWIIPPSYSSAQTQPPLISVKLSLNDP